MECKLQHLWPVLHVLTRIYRFLLPALHVQIVLGALTISKRRSALDSLSTKLSDALTARWRESKPAKRICGPSYADPDVGTSGRTASVC